MADPAASKQSGPDGTGTGRSGRGRSPSRSRLSTDVPEAVRDRAGATQSSARRGGGLWILLAVLIAIGAIAGWGLTTGQFQSLLPEADEPVVKEITDPVASPTINADDLLGHLPYEEAPADELVAISADGRFQAREAAAESYTRMAEEARRAGIPLVVLSAFRSIDLQQQIFFDIKASRRQTPGERAEVSAPPGYSEHHTGYAIDFGDGEAPSTHFLEDFETTRTFEWLD
ncbi:MAG: D-alanyl-D-alanine carboxypeptidase family protein, partial [Cyanobacteria bacterium P01_H01_bin.130]